jgi:hydrogenase maturation protein HypF
MLTAGVHVVPARGVGRAFDAAGALALGITHATFEGHAALALEAAVTADQAEQPYPITLPTALAPCPHPPQHPLTAQQQIDLVPLWQALVDDVLAGTSPATIAARFHASWVTASVALAHQACETTGARTVILTGGVFQNSRLEHPVAQRLGALVRLPREVPVNDGGLALGQAWAAVLTLQTR